MSHFSVYVFHDEYSSVDDILEPFSAHLECEPHIEYTKEEAVAKCRSFIENFKNGRYKDFLENPDAYRNEYGYNKKHINFLENEFPKMLNWTDDECYEYEKGFYDEDMIDEDGNLLTTFNPQGKWDWYEVGGRWSGEINENETFVGEINIDEISLPFAFITTDGDWVEKGHMGMFGIATDEMNEKDWKKKFRDYAKSVDKDILITIVDCHI